MTLKELADELHTSKKTLKQLCVLKDEQNISFEEKAKAKETWFRYKTRKQMPIKDRIDFEQKNVTFVPASKKAKTLHNKFYDSYDYKEAKTLETVIVLYCNGLTNEQIAREIEINKKYKDIANLSASEINQILVSHGHRANKIIDKKHSWNKTVS